MHFKVFVAVDQETNVFELLEQYDENGNLSFIEQDVVARIQNEGMPAIKRKSLDAGQKRLLKSAHKYYQNLEWIPSYVFQVYSSEHILPANELFVGEEGIRRFALDYMGYEEKNGKFVCQRNPHALYDYYTPGGRWEYVLPISQEGVPFTQELSKQLGEETKVKNSQVHASATKVKFIDWQFIKQGLGKEFLLDENNQPLTEQDKEEVIEERINQNFLPYLYINESGYIDCDGNCDGKEFNAQNLTQDEIADIIKGELMKEENQEKLIYVFDFHI